MRRTLAQYFPNFWIVVFNSILRLSCIITKLWILNYCVQRSLYLRACFAEPSASWAEEGLVRPQRTPLLTLLTTPIHRLRLEKGRFIVRCYQTLEIINIYDILHWKGVIMNFWFLINKFISIVDYQCRRPTSCPERGRLPAFQLLPCLQSQRMTSRLRNECGFKYRPCLMNV
jgi:hypothetical protein